MTRAVHGFEAVFDRLGGLVFDPSSATAADLEHVVLVILPVSRCLPERGFVDVGSEDFPESVTHILHPKERNKSVVDVCSIGKKER